MNKIDNNMSAYLHTYEAYRVPKGTTVKDMAGKEVVLSKEQDVLVLTEKSSRQLIEDRRDYGGMLQTKAELAAQKTQEEAKQQKKMEELCEASNEAAMAVGTGSHEFLVAQKQNIVEIVNFIDFSN